MTLDEAIKHAEEVAEEQNKAAKEWHENQKWCENCAEEHRKLAEWLKELKQFKEQEPCVDCISRQAVKDMLDARGVKAVMTFEHFKELLDNLPPVTPQQKMGHCKDCKYFEYDSVAKVDGIPLIVAHEICLRWGDGCKTNEDGYCFLFKPKMQEVEE